MSFNKSLFAALLISGFIILIGCEKGESPSDYLEYNTIAEIELPFSDEWNVVWGGRTIAENYHASFDDQRFAIDILQIENGSTFTGNGSRNEDYYCYGDTLYSPESGLVVQMKNSVIENTPGETNASELFGNYVVINHGNEEYSVMAHLIPNSIIVNVGNQISKGQEIGLCGNSGNSTEPHLHYHLQNNPSLGAGKGLPAQFNNYFADDIFIEQGEPSRGQRIRKSN